MENYNVRPYQRGDETGIVGLLDEVFDSGPHLGLGYSHLEHWRWKYADNPLGMMCISVAEDGGKIIGAVHSMLKRVKINNEIYIAGTGADAAVHPRYRRKGLFNELRDQLFSIHRKMGIRHHSAVSTNPILIERNIRRGNPEFPVDLVELARYDSFNSQLRQLRSSGIPYLTDRIRGMMSSSGGFNSDSIELSRIDSFDERFDAFWKRTASSLDYAVVRDAQYLNWRYCDPRGGDYDRIVATQEGEVHGYMILRSMRYKQRYPPPGGYIVDLINLPGEKEVAGLLVEHALDRFDGEELGFSSMWSVKGGEHHSIMAGLGFATSRRLNIFFTKMLTEGDLDNLNRVNAERTIFTYGDHDHI